MSLPESIIAGATGHVGHHNTLHELFNDGITDAHVAALAAIDGSKLDFSVGDASDVDLTGAAAGDLLRYDGSTWERGRPYVYDVTAAPYNATGDSTTDDTAAVQAAIDACVSGSGGIVVIPTGTYKLTDELVVPEGLYAPIVIQGTGGNTDGSTELVWSTDLGTGKYAIRSSNNTQRTMLTLRDLRLVGPNNVVAMGSSPADMDGVRLEARFSVRDCSIKGFRSGVVNFGDHNRLERTTVDGCYYGLYFASGNATNGDFVCYDSPLSGNLMASVGVADGRSLDTSSFIHGHIGYSPYGFYFEASGSAATRMYRTRFIGTTFESFGHAAFYSPDTNAVLDEVLMLNALAMFEHGAGYTIGAGTFIAPFANVRLTNWILDQVSARNGDGWGTNALLFDVHQLHGVVWRNSPVRAQLASAASASKPLARYAIGNRNRWQDGADQGLICKPSSSAAVTAKQVLGWLDSYKGRPYATGYAADPNTQVVGVALTTAPADNGTIQDALFIATEGIGIAVDTTDAVATSAQVMPAESDRNKITTYDGFGAHLGIMAAGASTGGAAATTIDLHPAVTVPFPAGARTTNVQIFTASGTWTKPTGATSVAVVCIGGGAGGGSGRRGAAGSVRCGGGGGGGGGISRHVLPASVCGGTETVTVGAGGAGGAAISVDDTNGAAGTAGGNSTFGTGLCRATGGGAGGGGTNAAGAAGTAGNGMLAGAAGGAASATGAAGNTGSAASDGAGGGGAGGGIVTGDTASAGGNGGSSPVSGTQGGAGAGGSSGGGTGANATGSVANAGIAGAGGGGGGSSITAAAGPGGNGSNYGGGGGGGGSSLNATGNSGTGGIGKDGIVVVTTYF